MSDDVKQVKVDNWGIYFLQRLKHFFNRTDYCDLTLQFQDNAQLKVHRLVLSACTEYFELLERTCEMYEDCLVMPDDLQADIVVPIVNFMYTGQLEFRMELLEKLHQCSEIMNMPVLTKLLDSHRPKAKITQSYNPAKLRTPKRVEGVKETIKSISATELVTTTPVTYKRSHSKAFESQTTVYRDKKVYLPINKPSLVSNGGRTYREPSPIPLDQRFNKKVISGDPRPTRYELPEELDSDNIFENSFCNISYASQPLMVHPDTRKQYSKRPKLIGEASSSKKFGGPTIVDIVECKKPIKVLEDTLFEDSIVDDAELYAEQYVKSESSGDPNQLFDQILLRNEESSKVTIETKNNKSSANLDHAKIISEVLKKYPHLVKSNKNIKLKILNTPTKNVKKQKLSPAHGFEKPVKNEKDQSDFTYETDVLDSKQAARLIAMGAENIEGPWICLICGTPGKAMNFTSYYKFRRHLVEVHREKPVLNICEHCGQRSTKRNYLLHHMYTKHNVEPPPQYHFPKCNQCNYIALTEALLVKHKASTHTEVKNFRCNVCPSAFNSSSQLLMHIQNTGHKYSADRKSNLQCIYCQKVFMREGNLCAHLKTHHRQEAIRDGIIDDSDDEMHEDKKNIVKAEPNLNEYEELDIQYQIQQRPDGNITVVTKKVAEPTTNTKQKILNAGLSTQALSHKNKVVNPSLNSQNEYVEEIDMSSSNDALQEIVMIDNNEYIMRDNQLVPRAKQVSDEFILSTVQPVTPTTSMEFTNLHNSNVQDNLQHTNMILKNPGNITQPIPIYVSNEEEYKALMASNQSIIIDSVDSNKTLTVLTAPHTSTLDTTAIDLDSTQSNDNMMIIQDDYPLNVSEAVASDSSNIVVVYSHQIGDQNKQYQLLTTQGLGAQFVQSSAILTQNYETITTTTPVMNANVLGKQVEVWQSNLQQIVDSDQIEITPVSSLQSIVEQNNQVQITNTAESNNDINELPQVELTSNVTETTISNTSVAPVSQCQDIVAEEMSTTEHIDENTEGEHADNTQNMSSIEGNNEGPIENIVEDTMDSAKPPDDVVENLTVPEEELIPNSVPIVEETEVIESQTYTQPEPNTQPTIENIDEVQHQSEEMSIDSQISEIENIQLSKEEESVSDPNNISDVPINADQTLTEDAIEKVQTLASEWSEEDTQEKQEESAAETALHSDSGELIDQQKDTETCEIEESIENIQQEVQKQINASPSPEEQENTNSSQEESGLEQENPSTVVADPAVAQEKISSLLNDWEDNDSQEDQNSDHENVPTETNEIVESYPETIEKENPDKQDKIKSLVSDWDEDDEENKS